MHEYSIVASLVDRAARESLAHQGAVVRKLYVRIGELAGVEVDLLATAFETFRGHGPCAGAELAIARVPAIWECRRCRQPIATGDVLRCPTCGEPARLTAGDDIVLDRIELEVPDV